MKRQSGFTLIELLVVIAIIGLLSAVVLAALNDARTKGADAAVKSNLANIRAQAELVADGNYDNVCTDTKVVAMQGAAQAANGGTAGVCNDAVSAWAISVPMKTAGKHWCVDSSGASKEESAALGAGITACP